MERTTLLQPLPPLESAALRSILRLYAAEEGLPKAILEAIRRIDILGTAIIDGYDLPSLSRLNTEDMRWMRRLNGHLQELASPKVGRDRQAIALANFRDLMFGVDDTDRWTHLKEVRNQLDLLYTVVGPQPFIV